MVSKEMAAEGQPPTPAHQPTPSRPALCPQGEGRDPGEAEALSELRRGQCQQHQADPARVVPQQNAWLPGEPSRATGTPARGWSGHRPWLSFQEPQAGVEG